MDSKEKRCEKKQQRRGGGVRPALGSISARPLTWISEGGVSDAVILSPGEQEREGKLVQEESLPHGAGKTQSLVRGSPQRPGWEIRTEKRRDVRSRRAELPGNTRKNKPWIQFRKVTFGSGKAAITS